MDTQNPYAAPRAGGELETSGGPKSIGPQPWEIGEVISQAWNLFKENWAVLLGTLVVGYVAIIVAQQIVAAVFGLKPQPGEYPNMSKVMLGVVVQTVLGQLVQAFVQVGWIRVALGVVRGENPSFSTFVSGGARYVPMLLTTLAVLVGVMLGMVALIIPGIILSMGLFFAQYYIADSEMGVVDALKASWEATSGQKASLFVFLFVLGLLNVGGAIACGVGLLATLPMSFVALAIVFTRVSGRMSGGTADGAVPGLVQG